MGTVKHGKGRQKGESDICNVMFVEFNKEKNCETLVLGHWKCNREKLM